MIISCSEDSSQKEETAKTTKTTEITEKTPSVSALKPINKRDLPSTVKPEGTLVYAGGWNDAEGEHVVTLSYTTSSREDTEYEIYYESKRLFAHHYLMDKGSGKYNETWKIREFVNDCEFDLTAEFIGSSIQLSDENKNGIAEVWTLYNTACRSDVSPCAMKLIMYEGAQKYAMRGSMKINLPDGSMGGEYKFDDAFLQSDKSIQEFAKKIWNANKEENLQ